MQLWNADVDTLEFFDKEEFIKGAHAVVLVYDANSYESFEAVAKVCFSGTMAGNAWD